MAAVTIPDLRAGIATLLKPVTSFGKLLQVHETWPGLVVPPAAIVDWKGWRVMTVDGALKEYEFELTVLAQLGDVATAQDEVDALASEDGAASIVSALYLDQTLGGIAREIHDMACRKEGGTIVYRGVEYAGFVISFGVLA